MKKLSALFWEMFKISLFVVGGGYAILAVADAVFSRKRKWTDEGEILSQLPLFQMFPGVIAGDTAIYVGRKVAGLPGAACALAGVALPSIAVFASVSVLYASIPVECPALAAVFASLRGFVAGLVGAMSYKMWKSAVRCVRSFLAFAAAFAALSFLRINPALVVGVAAFAGLAFSFAPRVLPGARRVRSSFVAMLFIFIKYGLVAFGGGYVLVPVYVADFVGAGARFLGLSGGEFANVMALTQMTPGPISVNCATFFGFKLGELDGFGPIGCVVYSVAATLCLLLPGAAMLYLALGSLERFGSSRAVKGITAAVKPVSVALMVNAAFSLLAMGAVDISPGGVAFDLTACAAAVFGASATLFRFAGTMASMAIAAAAALAFHFIAI